MVASALLMARALAPIERSIATWRAFIGARTAYRRLNELFRATATSRGVAMRVPPPEGRLSAERVVFVPPQGDRPTLKGVSFELEAGQSLAVVGPTAAGKSTLAKLIVGSWRPTAGAVRLDGASLWQEFTRVLLPLLLPGLAATSLLALIFTWNEFFFAVNLTTRDASPLSVYVSTFKAAQGDLFVAKMSAAATAAVIPVIVAGWIAQRQLVAGLTMGAVK